MVLLRFLDMAERNVVEIQCYDPQMGQGGCRALFRLSSAGHCRIDCTALWSFSLTALLIPIVPIWLIVTQQKSTGRQLMVCPAGFSINFLMDM